MNDLLKRIADYFKNDYQGDDKTAPTMEITVNDLRYIANMNVDRCRAEAELRNIKYNKGGVSDASDNVCEWRQTSTARYKTSCGYKLVEFFDTKACYCKQCGKKIKVVD